MAVNIPACERLVEDARSVLVLGAGGKMRIEQGRPLPPEQLQRAAAATLGRCIWCGALGHSDPADGENLGGHGGGETKSDHALNEAAAIHAAVLHLVDHGTQFVIQHGSPRPVRASSRRAAGVRRVWFWQMAIDGTPN